MCGLALLHYTGFLSKPHACLRQKIKHQLVLQELCTLSAFLQCVYVHVLWNRVIISSRRLSSKRQVRSCKKHTTKTASVSAIGDKTLKTDHDGYYRTSLQSIVARKQLRFSSTSYKMFIIRKMKQGANLCPSFHVALFLQLSSGDERAERLSIKVNII